MVRNVLTLAGYFALLLRFSGWMALACWPPPCPRSSPRRASRARPSGCATGARPTRGASRTSSTCSANDEHAKEVKLFGLGPLLLGRYRALAETFFGEDRSLAVRRAGWGYALSLISTGVFYGCYALIVAGHRPRAR